MNYHILPSILAADLTSLGQEIAQVIQAGADSIHFDVMDNHYVPNLSFGPSLCTAIRKRFPDIPIDVHLMTQPVDSLIEAFAHSGATRISIHPDSSIHLERSLQLIKSFHCDAGIVLNPASGIDVLQWCEHAIDFILVMTVNPGFGGQQLIPAVLKKIALINKYYPQKLICVDGGVNTSNIAQLAQAGATEFVAGSAIFAAQDYCEAIKKLRAQLRTVSSTS